MADFRSALLSSTGWETFPLDVFEEESDSVVQLRFRFLFVVIVLLQLDY